mgnify:CR=1 FL=1
MPLELLAKTCILEARKPGRDEWHPFEEYQDSLLEYEDIRLSDNARYLIEQATAYINLQNQ